MIFSDDFMLSVNTEFTLPFQFISFFLKKMHLPFVQFDVE